MQVSTSDDYDPDATISLTLIPSLTVPPGIPEPVRSPDPTVADLLTGEAEPEMGTREPQSPIQSLFAAVSACANLHPDPVTPNGEDGDEDVGGGPPVMFEGGVGYESTRTGMGLPPPVPGSGGWITAENVGEFFDEEGNFRGGVQGGGLGPGAGSVRGREEEVGGEEGRWEDADGEGEREGNGSGNGPGEETKWRRTE